MNYTLKSSCLFFYSLSLQSKQAIHMKKKTHLNDVHESTTFKKSTLDLHCAVCMCWATSYYFTKSCTYVCRTCTAKREICTLNQRYVWPSVTFIKALEKSTWYILIHVLPVYKPSYHHILLFPGLTRPKEPGPDKTSNLFTEEFNRKFFYRQG